MITSSIDFALAFKRLLLLSLLLKDLIDFVECMNLIHLYFATLLLERIWGYDSDVSMKTIDATVKLLRKKLDNLGKQESLLEG